MCIRDRDKTVQYIKAKDMIVEYIKKHGFINRMTVQELCGFSNQQARRTIEKMRKENIIVMSSGGKYAKSVSYTHLDVYKRQSHFHDVRSK